MQHIDLGTAVIKPSDFLAAGSLATLTFIYTAGHPIDDTGFLKIVFRFASDFGIPQFDHPERLNYCSVRSTGNCSIEPRWDPKGHTRPWGRSIFLKVMGGFLDRGQQIILVFGDTSGGSPGWQVQTFCENTFEFLRVQGTAPVAGHSHRCRPPGAGRLHRTLPGAGRRRLHLPSQARGPLGKSDLAA